MADAGKQLRSINCTQCGAPLNLLGGNRVKSINCGYCGSILDSRDEYKVIKRYEGLKRPSSPVRIGMEGRIRGVAFTVIGMIEYVSIDSRWVELLLFSPTHGYAWLEYEDGHFIFSRGVRDLPDRTVSHRSKSRFKARGRNFRVYEHYDARINYVEGELTWIAEKGDKVSITEGIDPPYIYCIEQTGKEQEYSFGEYLQPEEVYQAFRLSGKPRIRRGVHAAQPYIPGSLVTGLSRAGLIFMPIVLILYLFVLLIGSGHTVFNGAISAAGFLKGAATRQFDVTDPDHLLGLYLQSNLRNSWASYDITVMKDKQELFSLAKQISYYSGVEGGESWSEGSKSVKTYFKLPQAGKYNLYVSGEGGMGERGNIAQNTPLQIRIDEGVIVSRYFLWLLIIFSISAAMKKFRELMFEASRWSDEDD